MPRVWFQHRSALVLVLFFPWFPVLPLSPPEAEPPIAAPGPEEPLVLPGVVIEEIPKGSALEKAGVQAGDVILGWERLPNPPANPEAARGKLTSFSDWLNLVVEQVPRGTAVLRGRRGGEPLELKVEPEFWETWETKVRPVLAQALEKIYLAGKAQLASGDIEAAVRTWWSLADSSGGEGNGDLRGWLALRIGAAWGEAVQWDKAAEVFRETLEATKIPLVQIAIWVALGKANEMRNEYDAAEKAYVSALEIGQKLNPRSIRVSDSLNRLGLLAWTRGDLDHGQEYHLRALQIQEQLAPQSLYVAQSLNDLGILASGRGEFDRAQEYYLQALKIEEQLAPQSVPLAVTLSNLGSVELARGELGNAHSYLLRALKIYEQFAPGSLEVAACLNNLGILARWRGELDRARDYHLLSLTIQEKLAPQSLKVANSLNNLGAVARLRGELDRARDYHLHALRISERLAPHSLFVSKSLGNLGDIALDRGELDRAIEYYLQALRIQQQLAACGESRWVPSPGLRLEVRGSLT